MTEIYKIDTECVPKQLKGKIVFIYQNEDLFCVVDSDTWDLDLPPIDVALAIVNALNASTK